MNDLAWAAKRLRTIPVPPLRIKVSGYFRDGRSVPDLSNLHKVIGDALKVGLGVDDRHFRFEDGEVVTGADEPKIVIEVRRAD